MHTDARATLHTLVLIAAIPALLVLAIRFFTEEGNRVRVAIDVGLVAVIASILWTAGFGTKTVYGLIGYSTLLAVALLSLIVRWRRAGSRGGRNTNRKWSGADMWASSARRWGKTRQQGVRGMLRRGVLRWGVPMYFIMTALEVVQQPKQWLPIALIGVPVWLSGGVLWGALTWVMMERWYQWYLRKTEGKHA
jgi:hypothetical protein